MFVEDWAVRPREPITDLHHRTRERDRLVAVEWHGGTRRDEGREVDVRVLAPHHIRHDGAQHGPFEPIAVDAGAHAAEREHGIGMAHEQRIAVAQAKTAPSRLGQSGLVYSDETVRRLVERGDDLARPRAEEHARMRC
jgi:hypothetical protein